MLRRSHDPTHSSGEGQMRKTHPSPLRSCQETAPPEQEVRNRRCAWKPPVLRCTHLDACSTEPSWEQKSLPSSSALLQRSRVTRQLTQLPWVSAASTVKKTGWAPRTYLAVTNRQTSTAPCHQRAYVPVKNFLRTLSPTFFFLFHKKKIIQLIIVSADIFARCQTETSRIHLGNSSS